MTQQPALLQGESMPAPSSMDSPLPGMLAALKKAYMELTHAYSNQGSRLEVANSVGQAINDAERCAIRSPAAFAGPVVDSPLGERGAFEAKYRESFPDAGFSHPNWECEWKIWQWAWQAALAWQKAQQASPVAWREAVTERLQAIHGHVQAWLADKCDAGGTIAKMEHEAERAIAIVRETAIEGDGE